MYVCIHTYLHTLRCFLSFLNYINVTLNFCGVTQIFSLNISYRSLKQVVIDQNRKSVPKSLSLQSFTALNASLLRFLKLGFIMKLPMKYAKG